MMGMNMMNNGMMGNMNGMSPNMMNNGMMGNMNGMNPNMMNNGMMGNMPNMMNNGMFGMNQNMMNNGMMGNMGMMDLNTMNMINMMNMMNMMNMGGIPGMAGNNTNMDDAGGWNLVFENQNDRQSYPVTISEQKTIKEAISIYRIKSGNKDPCKFIVNSKELYPEMRICESGLQNNSRILVISTRNLQGAF